jgi:hypothetical protein
MSQIQVFTEERLEEFSQALIRWKSELAAHGESQMAVYARYKLSKTVLKDWLQKKNIPTPSGLLRMYQASKDPTFIMTSNEVALAMVHPRRTVFHVPDEMHDLAVNREALQKAFDARPTESNGAKIDVTKKIEPAFSLERATAIAHAVARWYKPISEIPLKQRGAEFARQDIPLKVVNWRTPPNERPADKRLGAPTPDEMLKLYEQTSDTTFLLTSEEIARLQRKLSRVPEKLIKMRHLADEVQARTFGQAVGKTDPDDPKVVVEEEPVKPETPAIKAEKPAAVRPHKSPVKKPDETVRERVPEQPSVLQMIAYALQSLQSTVNLCAEMSKSLDGVPEKQRKKAAAVIRQLIRSFNLTELDFQEFTPEEITDPGASTRLNAILGKAFGKGGDQ